VNRLRQQRDHRSATAFIMLDARCCKACWECVVACPQEVFGKVDFLGHRHARIRAADLCTGCGRCVKACESTAVTRRPDAAASNVSHP
jgi:2-oxoglutarate ferredoxin oxidoreductase subunit delta